MADELLPLTEVIRSLRGEIINAVKIGEKEPIHFDLGPIELEFTVVAKREGAAGSKINFSVLGIGATVEGSGKISSEYTHKIKLTLSPNLDGDRKVQIRRRG